MTTIQIVCSSVQSVCAIMPKGTNPVIMDTYNWIMDISYLQYGYPQLYMWKLINGSSTMFIHNTTLDIYDRIMDIHECCELWISMIIIDIHNFAVAPLITHWSCGGLAVCHRYNTVATGLGRKQSSNREKTSHIPPPQVSLGMSVFLRIYEIYHAMMAPRPHWNLVYLFFPQRCTPRTYNFVLAMYHLHWLMLCY